jgi:hypothetical protein
VWEPCKEDDVGVPEARSKINGRIPVVILIHVSCIMLNYQVAIRFLAIDYFSYDLDFNRLFVS